MQQIPKTAANLQENDRTGKESRVAMPESKPRPESELSQVKWLYETTFLPDHAAIYDI